jgi:hypothetical protein
MNIPQNVGPNENYVLLRERDSTCILTSPSPNRKCEETRASSLNVCFFPAAFTETKYTVCIEVSTRRAWCSALLHMSFRIAGLWDEKTNARFCEGMSSSLQEVQPLCAGCSPSRHHKSSAWGGRAAKSSLRISVAPWHQSKKLLQFALLRRVHSVETKMTQRDKDRCKLSYLPLSSTSPCDSTDVYLHQKLEELLIPYDQMAQFCGNALTIRLWSSHPLCEKNWRPLLLGAF